MQNQSSLLFLLIIVVVIGYFIYKHKKNKNKSTESKRKNKDEVWKTIKTYLKSNDNYGVEIIDSYVARKHDIDFIDENLPKFIKNKKNYEIKLRKYLYKTKKKQYVRLNRELYVVCFQTKNTKFNTVNPPQAFQCEVVRSKNKNIPAKIQILGTLDFDTEMQWIAPIRAIELKKNEISAKAKQKAEQKIKNKKAKKKKK